MCKINRKIIELRAEKFNKLEKTNFDLLIIGGGITGAGIALDSASRGMKVALVEMNDFASGTSSRSTKLVHGGLRYLEKFKLGMVRRLGKEREIVYKNAPHIVRPQKMLLPIIKKGSLSKFTAYIALSLYDFLAKVKKTERKIYLNKNEIYEKLSAFDKNILKAGIMYYEYTTSDARLTVEVLKKAEKYEAVVINYAKFNSFIYENKKISGIELQDTITGNKYSVKSKYVVNASGPWTDKVARKDGNYKNDKIVLSKGIHIVVSQEKLNLKQAVYFDTGDKRMIFAIPKKDKIYIGTTDEIFTGDINNVPVLEAEIDYLISSVNRVFTSKLKSSDIEASWAGLRPLISGRKKKTSELSRKDEIFISKNGLISISGGKLTGYRLMAKKITDIIKVKLEKESGNKFKDCFTENIKLSGGEFDFEPDSVKFNEYIDHRFDEARQTGIEYENFRTLFFRYGKNIEKITDKAYDFYNETKNTETAWQKAEIFYSKNYEYCIKQEDFLIRRTEKGLFG